jgi:hypothetical protein
VKVLVDLLKVALVPDLVKVLVHDEFVAGDLRGLVMA